MKRVISGLTPAVVRQLAAWQVDIDSSPPKWHEMLEGTLRDGAFVELRFGFGAGGVIDAKLQLVAPDGSKRIPLSEVGPVMVPAFD